jgi:phosphomannomutase/phosphoglucomutase
MNPRVFREYDIRGVADVDFDDASVDDLGRAIGTWLRRAGSQRITLGRDCRLSSPRIHAALRRALSESGLQILDVGVVATPMLYFSVFHFDADGGVMITASHNPGPDNGFKVLRGKSTIHGAEIQKLRELVERRDFDAAPRPGGIEHHDIADAYQAHARFHLERMGDRRFPVVVDGGNGSGGPFCVPLLRELGFDVTPLYCEMDGRFPNHHPDPTVEKNVADLKREVAARGAEVGVALDGDADRLGIVDGKGRIVWGDQLMILFARDILAERPGTTFVSEVKCSQALYDEIAKAGGRAIMWKVGHSLIKEKMKLEKAALAGEMSGHMFFADRYPGYDDAIYAAARLCELLSRSERTLAELVDTLPKLYNTPEIRVDCPDTVKFEVVRRAVERFRKSHEVIDIDGARIQFPDGWGLVRASNTGPVLVLRFEAATPARLEEIRAWVEGELGQIKKEMGVA